MKHVLNEIYEMLCLTAILSKVVLHVRMQKKHQIISGKRSTETVLNLFPSIFVTPVVLPDVFSTAKSGTTFRRSS